MRAARHAGLLGLLIFIAAALGFGVALEGYSQIEHLLDVLGAKGMPRATAFNLIGLVLPGLLAVIAALQLRPRMPEGSRWPVRIGAQLLLLSALGLVAFGVFPVDPADLHNSASGWHAVAWMLWWVAFVPGGLLLGWGLRGAPAWRTSGWLAALTAVALLALVMVGVELLPAGFAQRLAFAIWWGWLVFASYSGRATLSR